MPTATLVLFLGDGNVEAASTLGLSYDLAADPAASVPANDYAPDAGVQIWNNSTAKFAQYVPGFNSDGYGGPAWGFEASFAQSYRSVVGDPLYIYKQWSANVALQKQAPNTDDWSPLSLGKEWDKLVAGFASACAALGSTRTVAPVVVWIGGAADTGSLTAAQNYRTNLARLDLALRDGLGIANVLLIANRPGPRPPNGPWAALARMATERFVKGNPRRAFLDVDALPFGNVTAGAYDPSAVVSGGRQIFQIAYDRVWSGDNFAGIALPVAQFFDDRSWHHPYSSFGVRINARYGATIRTGLKGYLRVPFSGVLVGMTLMAEQSGSIVFDIEKSTAAEFPPGPQQTIVGDNRPTLANAKSAKDPWLWNWQTAVDEGDVLAFRVLSCTGITTCTLSLLISRASE